MKTYINYRVGLSIGLLSFNTFSSCVNTKQGMDPQEQGLGSDLGPITGPVTKRTPLAHAIKNGNKPILEALLRNPQTNINDTGTDLTSLLLALKRDQPDIAMVLLNAPKSAGQELLNVTDKDTESEEAPLGTAARKNWRNLVNALLSLAPEYKVDVNVTDKNGNTPLYGAAKEGHIDIVEMFLKVNNIDINTQNNLKETALHAAASRGHLEIVKFLLEKLDIDVNAKDIYDRTPLWLVAALNRVGIVEVLLDPKYKVDVNVADQDGYTALHMAARSGYADVVELLLQVSNVDIKHKDGHTILHMAASEGEAKVAEVILEANNKNIDINGKDADGNTALHLAAKRGKLPVIQVLLKHEGIQKNKKNKDGKTPLEVAKENNHQDCVEALQKGTKPDSDETTKNPVDSKVENPMFLSDQIIEDLKNNNWSPERLTYWIDRGLNVDAKDKNGDTLLLGRVDNEVAIQFLLDNGADMNKGNKYYGKTLLHIATKKGYLEVTRRLLNQDNNDANTRTTWGNTPLHLAAEGGHLQIFKLLLPKTNGGLNVRNNNDNTPLHLAAGEGMLPVVEFLVNETDSNVNQGNNNNNTPLHLAAEGGHLKIIQLLLEKEGILAEQENIDGKTPLQVAKENNHQDCVEALQEFIDSKDK